MKEFYSRVLANGDIYKADYEGLYCINCEEYKVVHCVSICFVWASWLKASSYAFYYGLIDDFHVVLLFLRVWFNYHWRVRRFIKAFVSASFQFH